MSGKQVKTKERPPWPNPDISEVVRLAQLQNYFLFLIKAWLIMSFYYRHRFRISQLPQYLVEIRKLKVLISLFSIITSGINCHRYYGYLALYVSNKHNNHNGSAFYDMSIFFLIYIALGCPLTCFVAFSIKWNGINAHLKLIMLILQMQIACYLQSS